MRSLAFLSDPHILAKKPVARNDDAAKASMDKFRWVLEYCAENKAKLVISGDLTDKPRSWMLLPQIAKLLNKYGVDLFSVFGQHDTYLYSSERRERTIMGVLSRSGLVRLLIGPTYPFGKLRTRSASGNEKRIVLYGANYNRETSKAIAIPKPKKLDDLNILVIHAPIAKRALWHSQQYMKAEEMLEECKEYDIIHCGDIHRQFFITETKGRTILNTGPMVRKTSEEYNFKHRPMLFVCHFGNYGEKYWNKVEIPHEPADTVLSRSHIDRKKQLDISIEKFVRGFEVAEEEDLVIEIVKRLFEMAEANDIGDEVIDLLQEVIDEDEE